MIGYKNNLHLLLSETPEQSGWIEPKKVIGCFPIKASIPLYRSYDLFSISWCFSTHLFFKLKNISLLKTDVHYKTFQFFKLKFCFIESLPFWILSMKCSADWSPGFRWDSTMKTATSHFCNNGIYNVVMYASNKTLQGMFLYWNLNMNALSHILEENSLLEMIM